VNRKQQKAFWDAVTYILLILGSVIMLGPFLWMVSTAFKLPADQFTRTLLPPTWTLQNFRDLFGVDINFPLLFFNSVYISLLITAGTLFTCSMAAFCFAVVRFKGRDALFVILLITLMIPAQVTLIPNFIVFKFMGVIGTSIPLWLPAFLGGAFGIFLMRQYFLTIPKDFVDAARMDGASLFQIYWKLYMPLAKPALAALAIFTFQGAWNDLLHPLVYMPAVPNTTLTVGLAFFQQQLTTGGKFTVLMAGALISILPLIIVFFIAQKQFIEGISLSGVKR
jgi:ABC-type glycerol-3-phosphate transport system permease component